MNGPLDLNQEHRLPRGCPSCLRLRQVWLILNGLSFCRHQCAPRVKSILVVSTWLLAGWAFGAPGGVSGAETIDFNRDIRPILSNQCIACHGPDDEERKAGFRLDTRDGATADLGGYRSIVPGDPDSSEVISRLLTEDDDERMPPPSKGPRLSAEEIDRIRKWIAQGARYAAHWAYVPPIRATVPAVSLAGWPVNEIDAFILARLEKEGLQPEQEADLKTLIRRVSLDLTGLPPSWSQVEAAERTGTSGPYERFVDELLSSDAFGEHWATGWLDLARYADSSGYPSDQPREIWGYRDWVINALNRNLPFDQFTIDQLAGDLLPGRTRGQLVATAFHRNTMTQNEGGTNDEEFRVAAVVDRVNTTMAVWMGTTMACAQCHTHKYDPITQRDYYRFFAILNQSADSDRKDEAPVIPYYSDQQLTEKTALESELADLEKVFTSPSPESLEGQSAWEAGLPVNPAWRRPRPISAKSSRGQSLTIEEDGRIFVPGAEPEASGEVTRLEFALDMPISAVRLEALADSRLPGNGPGHAGGNFVVTSVAADLLPSAAKPVLARRLRIETDGEAGGPLALAEVEVFSDMENVAIRGKATQVSTSKEGGGASLAIDGRSEGQTASGKAVALTAGGGEPQWWQLEFDAAHAVDRITIWKPSEKGPVIAPHALRLILFSAEGETLWEQVVQVMPGEAQEISVSGRRRLRIADAFADATQSGFSPRDVLARTASPDKGWAVSGFTGNDRTLTLVLAEPVYAPPGRIILRLEQRSKWHGHTLGSFRAAFTGASGMTLLAALPEPIRAGLLLDRDRRTAGQQDLIRDYFVRNVSLPLSNDRKRMDTLRSTLAGIRPSTIPVMQELPEKQRRVTKINIRGNWQNLGEEVEPGVPEAFAPLPAGVPANRLGLARWLVGRDNPLTARVIVNRYWEAIFGVGLVRTSEEFGSQGEAPFHPELLDWLAVDFMENGWDVKRLLRQMVTSRAYRQDSCSSPALNERDPDNRLLARGPRFRSSGEMIRDQALAVSGLLSRKMGGPPVRPASPSLGLSTAFGRSNDWVTSVGEDRYRRAVYTEVRRNAPYASFVTFDAPNREVCAIRRNRTNTPLQAFVTLNDPVFVEASQSVARRMAVAAGPAGADARIKQIYRICLSRDPSAGETGTLRRLYDEALARYGTSVGRDAAVLMATQPLGAIPDGLGLTVEELAAWTVVANVILNLDEFLMRR